MLSHWQLSGDCRFSAGHVFRHKKKNKCVVFWYCRFFRRPCRSGDDIVFQRGLHGLMPVLLLQVYLGDALLIRVVPNCETTLLITKEGSLIAKHSEDT